MWAERPLPVWFWTHNDARLSRVPVWPASSIRDVPLYIRLQAREYHEALREAWAKGASAKAQRVYMPPLL